MAEEKPASLTLKPGRASAVCGVCTRYLGMQYSPKSSLASWPVEMTSPDAATSGTAGALVGCCPVGASAAGAARHCGAAYERASEAEMA